MSATYRLFTRWKNAKGFRSERSACLALGLSPGAIVHWKDGRNGEPEYIEKMAHDLGEDPVKTILEAYAEQKTGASQRVLVKLSKRFGAVVVCLLSMTTADTQALVSEGHSHQEPLYIMRSTVILALLYSIALRLWKGLNKWTLNNTPHPLAFA